MGTLALVLAGLVALVAVAIRGEPAPATRSERVHEIAATLRCPVCEDLSVADSPAPLAAQMRAQIDQQLAAGRSADQIRQGFVAAYGDSVLLTPPHRGIGQVAYLLPVVVLTTGVLAAGLLLRAWRRRDPPETAATDADAEAEAADGRDGAAPSTPTAADRGRLERALARLREEEP